MKKRFANLLYVTKNSDKMWKIVKRVKKDSIFSKSCTTAFYGTNDIDSNVRVVQKLLKINPFGFNWTEPQSTMTSTNLAIAAEMFLYLNTCPDILKSWILFYTDLFTNQSPDKIVLTLNRILKVKNSPQKIGFKNIAENLFKKTENLFSLRYKDIQNLLKGKGNSSLSSDGGKKKTNIQ